MAVRIAFFGNSVSSFSARHFAALLAVPCELVGVVDVPAAKKNTTNPLAADLPDFVVEARERSIQTFEPANPNSPDFIDSIRILKPDLFIAAGYALILGEKALAVPRLLAANFHASLLPEYRGKHPVFWALRHGEKYAGLTVHAMDPGIDTGDIIYQVKIRTRQDDTVATLYTRIMDQSEDFVGQLIADAERGRIPRKPQPENTGSYFSSTTEEDFYLNWTWPAEKIKRFITITPGKCFSMVGGQKVFFLNAEQEAGVTTSTPGTLVEISNSSAAVATGSGIISSRIVQIGCGETESFAGFCRREGFNPGDSLIR
jgi:methionyl-tRNA formyltransferase